MFEGYPPSFDAEEAVAIVASVFEEAEPERWDSTFFPLETRVDVQGKQVLEVLRAVEARGLRVWLDGGWGVDALLGKQTRDHEDVDIVVELDKVDELARTLGSLGFELVEDLLPTRAVLRSADSGQVDVHPVTFDGDGVGWQRGAGPDGADCPYPADGFGQGRLLGSTVPCLTAEVQLEHHCGYEPRERDRRDMAALAQAYGLVLPRPS